MCGLGASFRDVSQVCLLCTWVGCIIYVCGLGALIICNVDQVHCVITQGSIKSLLKDPYRLLYLPLWKNNLLGYIKCSKCSKIRI